MAEQPVLQRAEEVAAIYDAMPNLKEVDPAPVVKLESAMKSARGRAEKIPEVEKALCEASTALRPVDADAAESFFILANIMTEARLAQSSR
jgi:hypothetical protein